MEIMYAIIENSEQLMENKMKFSGNPDEILSIKSRFGEISIDLSKAIYFPKGIFGFPENLHFALANFPSEREELQYFKILQCINDHSISIPVLPAAYENRFIDAADMEECIKTVEVKKENLAMLFIVSSSKQMDGFFRLFVNTKAPVVVDTSLQMAVQYVFSDNKYSVRQTLDSKKM